MHESTATAQVDRSMSFGEKVTTGKSGFSKKIWIFWALLGPGIISSLSNNDAGGMISYTMTGATFGISLFIPLLFMLAPIDYNMQEMSMRLSAVTHTEYRELVLRHFGRFWSYASVSALSIANLLYMITEFVGMTAGLTLLGLPLWAGDIVSLAFVSFVTFFMGYWKKERFVLFVAAINVVFIIAAFLSHPNSAQIVRVFTTWPNISWNLNSNGMLVFIMATIGNCIAPFMLFFQSNANIDKKITAKDLRLGRTDIVIGSFLQPLFAMTVMLCGAALFGKLTHLDNTGPTGLISALIPVAGHLGSNLFAIGLFNAGWLAAITISLSTAYTIAGSLGWKRSLNHKFKEAPRFYSLYLGFLLLAAIIILIPGLPLGMLAVFTQIIVAVLFIPDLIFLVLLTSNRKIMGEHVNRWWKRIIGWGIVAIFAIVSVISISITFVNM